MPIAWALLRAAGADRRLSCSAAFAVCEAQSVTPAQVGEAVNELGIRLTQCQLGLFGRTPGEAAPPTPSASLTQAVGAYKPGGLPCIEAWRIAAALGESREAIGAAADSAGVRIVACQLGCF